MLHLPATITHPSPRQLRQFAAVLPLAVLLVGGVLRLSTAPVLIACVVSSGMAIIAWPYPSVVKPIYFGLSLLAYPIGLLVSEVVMLAVYLVMITPIAVFFRITGRDALERTIDRNAETYWQAKKQPDSSASYLRRW